MNMVYEMDYAINLVRTSPQLNALELDDWTRHPSPRVNLTWYSWLENWVEDIHALGINITRRNAPLERSKCRYRATSEQVFWGKDIGQGIEQNAQASSILNRMLQPKNAYKQEAEPFLALAKVTSPGKIFSVHVRNFEGGCLSWENTPRLDGYDNRWTCNLTKQTVEEKLMPFLRLDPRNFTIVVISDGQDPHIDETYSKDRLYNGSYQGSIWVALLSDVHYGTASSSLDHALYEWREPRPTYLSGDRKRKNRLGT